MKKILFLFAMVFIWGSISAQIDLTTNFKAATAQPLDTRDTLTTLADTANVDWTYPGLLSYAADVDQFWYYTGSFWKQLQTGSILNNYPGSTTKFASDTSVAPDTTGAPSTNEIEVWNYTTQDTNWLNSVIFYTGTDDSTDVITYVYFIDSDGNATLLESPTDPVNFTRRLIPSPAFANANQPLDSEALTFINNLSPPAKPLTVFIQADGAVPGAGTSDNPETAWLYDGVNVTRVKDFPRKFEVPGSAFADSTDATGTEVLTWLLSNPQAGNYLMAYHVGSGTVDKPDFAWWIAGDNNVGYSDIVTIKEPSGIDSVTYSGDSAFVWSGGAEYFTGLTDAPRPNNGRIWYVSKSSPSCSASAAVGDPTRPFCNPWQAVDSLQKGDFVQVYNDSFFVTNVGAGGDVETSLGTGLSTNLWGPGDITWNFDGTVFVMQNSTNPATLWNAVSNTSTNVNGTLEIITDTTIAFSATNKVFNGQSGTPKDFIFNAKSVSIATVVQNFNVQMNVLDINIKNNLTTFGIAVNCFQNPSFKEFKFNAGTFIERSTSNAMQIFTSSVDVKAYININIGKLIFDVSITAPTTGKRGFFYTNLPFDSTNININIDEVYVSKNTKFTGYGIITDMRATLKNGSSIYVNVKRINSIQTPGDVVGSGISPSYFVILSSLSGPSSGASQHVYKVGTGRLGHNLISFSSGSAYAETNSKVSFHCDDCVVLDSIATSDHLISVVTPPSRTQISGNYKWAKNNVSIIKGGSVSSIAQGAFVVADARMEVGSGSPVILNDADGHVFRNTVLVNTGANPPIANLTVTPINVLCMGVYSNSTTIDADINEIVQPIVRNTNVQ